MGDKSSASETNLDGYVSDESSFYGQTPLDYVDLGN